MKKFIYVIEVEGTGQFPFDMLRYDQCAPVGPDDASKLDRGEGGFKASRRTVRLNCYNHAPTPDRWSSFGWAMREIEKVKV